MEPTKTLRASNMIRRRRASKEPYEGYTLPAVSEKGGQFVDFNRIIERKPLKRVVKVKKV
jgi:hypothetical protein